MKKIFRWFGIFILAVISISIFWAWRSDIPADEIQQKYGGQPSRYLSLLGMSVHYRDQGNPADSLPLVLVHGTSSSLHTWEGLVRAMGGSRRIITFDLPGFGLTGASPENRYSYSSWNIFLDSLTDRLGIRRFYLGGNSLGGGVAWNYALHSPDKVAGLILIDASGYPRKNEQGAIGFRLASVPVLNLLMLRLTPRILIRQSLEASYGNSQLITEELVDRYLELLVREGNRAAALSLFQNPLRPDPVRIRKIRVPTLIIWGKEDKLIDYRNAARFAADIPGARAEVLEGVGHIPMEESPDRVGELIRSFLLK